MSEVRRLAWSAKVAKFRNISERCQNIKEELSSGQKFLLEIVSEKGGGGGGALVAVRLVVAVIEMMVPAVHLMLVMLVVVLVKWTLWWQQLARSIPMLASDVEARLHHSGHELRTYGHNSLPHSNYWWSSLARRENPAGSRPPHSPSFRHPY